MGQSDSPVSPCWQGIWKLTANRIRGIFFGSEQLLYEIGLRKIAKTKDHDTTAKPGLFFRPQKHAKGQMDLQQDSFLRRGVVWKNEGRRY